MFWACVCFFAERCPRRHDGISCIVTRLLQLYADEGRLPRFFSEVDPLLPLGCSCLSSRWLELASPDVDAHASSLLSAPAASPASAFPVAFFDCLFRCVLSLFGAAAGRAMCPLEPEVCGQTKRRAWTLTYPHHLVSRRAPRAHPISHHDLLLLDRRTAHDLLQRLPVVARRNSGVSSSFLTTCPLKERGRDCLRGLRLGTRYSHSSDVGHVDLEQFVDQHVSLLACTDVVHLRATSIASVTWPGPQQECPTTHGH